MASHMSWERDRLRVTPKFYHNVIPHLINGTGNACAWHKRAKLVCTCRTNMLILESVEKAGALLPTGSE